jgi:hypothetical protein
MISDLRNVRSLPDAIRVIRRLDKQLDNTRHALEAAKERAQSLEDRIGVLTRDKNELLGLAPEHRLPPKPAAEPVNELERKIQAELNNPHDVESHRVMAWIMSPQWQRVVDGVAPSGWPPGVVGEEYIRREITEQLERFASGETGGDEAPEDEPEQQQQQPEDEPAKPKGKLHELFERHAGR